MNLTPLTELIEGSPSLAALRAHSSGAVTVGASDAAKPAIAAVIARASVAPLIVLTARPTRAEALVEELPTWLGDTVPVHPFPERDPLPYERIQIYIAGNNIPPRNAR